MGAIGWISHVINHDFDCFFCCQNLKEDKNQPIWLKKLQWKLIVSSLPAITNKATGFQVTDNTQFLSLYC